MIPVGTKVMIMSKSCPQHNGEIRIVEKVLVRGDPFTCRTSGKTLIMKEIDEGYLLDKSFFLNGSGIEAIFSRSSLRVIDDKPCGQSFEEVMTSVFTKTGIVDTRSVNMAIKVWSEQIDKEEP